MIQLFQGLRRQVFACLLFPSCETHWRKSGTGMAMSISSRAKLATALLTLFLAALCVPLFGQVAYAVNTERIQDVELTITPPKCGMVVEGNTLNTVNSSDRTRQLPQPEVAVPAGAGYELAGSEEDKLNYGLWCKHPPKDASELIQAAFQGKMEGGATYYAVIFLYAINEDKPFSDNLQINVKGGKLVGQWGPEVAEYGYWGRAAIISVEAQHVPGNTVTKNVVKPTCTEDGSHVEETICKECNKTCSSKTVTDKAIGHNWGDWTITKQPTPTAAGEKQRVCNNDSSHVEKESIPATGQKSSDGFFIATMTTSDKDGLNLKWTQVDGAEGYDVFFSRCNHGKKKMVPKIVETVKADEKLFWSTSGLQEKKAYKARVKAWVKKNGKKTYIKSTPLVHAYTSGYTSWFTNAESVSVKATKVSLEKGKTLKIGANVKKLKSSKMLMPKSHARKLRYATSNKKIATVSRGGKVKGVKNGTCYVYAYAHNGAYKKVEVTVTNPTKLAKQSTVTQQSKLTAGTI